LTPITDTTGLRITTDIEADETAKQRQHDWC
jgi:hypothetical protein